MRQADYFPTSFCFCFFLILHDVKASGLQINFNIINFSTWHTIKTNCKKLWAMEPDMLDFDFLEKGLGIVSPHFEYDF